MGLSLDYKNYGKPVVSNIRNRTTNINTIKPHKITKKRRNQIWHAVTEKLYKNRLKLNRNSEQNNQTKLTIKTERLVQSKTYVNYRTGR
jgi:hypothetical protein